MSGSESSVAVQAEVLDAHEKFENDGPKYKNVL
jgi:hypothetical protein